MRKDWKHWSVIVPTIGVGFGLFVIAVITYSILLTILSFPIRPYFEYPIILMAILASVIIGLVIILRKIIVDEV